MKNYPACKELTNGIRTDHTLNGRPPDIDAYLKIFFFFLNQNICCWCSKEPSHFPKHMFTLICKGKKTNLREKMLNWTYGIGSLTWSSFDSVLIRTLRLGLHVQKITSHLSQSCVFELKYGVYLLKKIQSCVSHFCVFKL